MHPVRVRRRMDRIDSGVRQRTTPSGSTGGEGPEAARDGMIVETRACLTPPRVDRYNSQPARRINRNGPARGDKQAHYLRSSPDATQTRGARNLGRLSFRLHAGETLAQAVWQSAGEKGWIGIGAG